MLLMESKGAFKRSQCASAVSLFPVSDGGETVGSRRPGVAAGLYLLHPGGVGGQRGRPPLLRSAGTYIFNELYYRLVQTCNEFILAIFNREETILQASQLKKSARRRGLQVRIATRQESHLTTEMLCIIFLQ